MRLQLIAALLGILFTGMPSPAAPTPPATSNRMTPTVKAVHSALPAVVNISTERIVRRQYWAPEQDARGYDDLADMFFGREAQQSLTSLGSGFLIDSSGLVVTNAHVVSRASRIHITSADGKQLLAEEIASDPVSDLALVRIKNTPEKSDFKEIPFAKPDDLILGEPVIAVGNPYGLGSSISEGVLSAFNRNITLSGRAVMADLLQTDAAINPGNSGGPLINLDGELIGINTIVLGQANGIGFAIPLKRIENLLATWLIPERFTDVTLGLVPGMRQNKDGIWEIYLAGVLPESPAAKAGLKEGETITAIDGLKPDSLISLSRKLFRLKVGDTIALSLADGRKFNLKVEPLPQMDGRELAERRLGIGLQELTPQLAEAMGYPFSNGLLVSDMKRQDPDIRRGDLLAMINDTCIYSFTDVARALKGKRHGEKVVITLVALAHQGANCYLVKRRTELELL